MPITTNLDKFRLELGDTDEDAPLFNDVEANYFLDEHDDVLLAVAAACESLARRFARDYDFETGSGTNARRSFKRSQRSQMYLDMAKDLRKRAGGGGLVTLPVTRVDGYSEDITTRDGGGQSDTNGRVRRGYYDNDLPR